MPKLPQIAAITLTGALGWGHCAAHNIPPWDKDFRTTFVDGCKQSQSTGLDAKELARMCSCVAGELERNLPQQRMIEMSQPVSGGQASPLAPYVQIAKEKCAAK